MKLRGCLSRYRKWLLVSALVLPLLAALLPCSPVLAAPAVTVSPASGAIGTTIKITGTNYDSYKGDNIKITFDAEEIPGSPFVIPDTGTFEIPFTILGGTGPGIYMIEATIIIGTSVSSYVSTFFKVVSAEIELDFTDGPVGTEVTVSGRGFYSGRTATIYYYNVIREKTGSVTASETGTFAYQFTIPASVAGTHRITAENIEGNFAETSFEVIPTISRNLSTGSPWSLLTVSGNGFAARSQVSIHFGTYTVASVKSDEFGNFSINFNIPEVNAGTHDVKAQDTVGNLANTSFTTTAGARLSALSGYIGLPLTVQGIAFNAGVAITVDYDSLRVGTATADNNGAFTVSFTIPQSNSGDHVIKVSDGTNSRNLAFRVESDPPPVPAPVLPAPGSQTNAATYLDWQDVTDASLPVTYKVHLASDENFSSVILEKTGLTESQYTLSEGEWLTAGPSPVAHYWRVRAMDSAGNESEWSAPSSFYVSAPPLPEIFQSEPGATFEKTIFLNWQDVTSLSPPVDYTLQIAPDLRFMSIIVEKPGLGDSEYYLSSAEELELFIKGETYYWRVKATDAVNNESGWTPPASFTMASSFTWPSWATYLLIGIAVIIIVYLAFRFGKRTALQPPD